jgi:hypothetical protein
LDTPLPLFFLADLGMLTRSCTGIGKVRRGGRSSEFLEAATQKLIDKLRRQGLDCLRIRTC